MGCSAMTLRIPLECKSHQRQIWFCVRMSLVGFVAPLPWTVEILQVWVSHGAISSASIPRQVEERRTAITSGSQGTAPSPSISRQEGTTLRRRCPPAQRATFPAEADSVPSVLSVK